jgi:microsomal epoxide hydrolase
MTCRTKQEEHINSFPAYKYHVIDDDKRAYDIHFTALFSPRKDAIPILFLHGWPGSFLEFLPMMSMLRTKYTSSPSSFPFHIIVPSLPGFGFTKVYKDKNYTQKDTTRLLNKMMVGLGFGKGGYLAQGGDLGSGLARGLAVDYDEVKAAHINMLVFSPPKGPVPDPSPIEMAALARMGEFGTSGMGYANIHGTRPSTIGLTVASNPVSLLTWQVSSKKYKSRN